MTNAIQTQNEQNNKLADIINKNKTLACFLYITYKK
jgi:hypothetical protein